MGQQYASHFLKTFFLRRKYGIFYSSTKVDSTTFENEDRALLHYLLSPADLQIRARKCDESPGKRRWARDGKGATEAEEGQRSGLQSIGSYVCGTTNVAHAVHAVVSRTSTDTFLEYANRHGIEYLRLIMVNCYINEMETIGQLK